MNLGMIISYIIAGFLIITIIMTSMNLNQSSSELTATQMKKTHSKSVTEILTHDIPKIGFNRTTVLDPMFAVADSNEIEFYSNIDNSDDESVETINWKYTDTPAPGSKNPNDHILTRTVDGAKTDINLGVTRFEIRYYNVYGSQTPMETPLSAAQRDSIKQIEIELELQSAFELQSGVNTEGRYVTTSWIKRFSPVNLREN